MTTNNKGKNGIKLDKEIKDNEKQEEEEKEEEGKMVMRLAKRLACAGYASRRQAEVLIRGGHVRVNGRFVEEVGTNVHATKDVVSVDGVVIPAMEKTRVYIAHKLKGVRRNFKEIFVLFC
jgi:23S rRNA pseudouridine2605 synthase